MGMLGYLKKEQKNDKLIKLESGGDGVRRGAEAVRLRPGGARRPPRKAPRRRQRRRQPGVPFQERSTKRKLFYRLDRRVVIDVPYMQSFDRQCIKVLKLWYKTEPYQFGRKKNNFTRYSMCVFLPDAYDGLWSLVDKITSRPSFLYEHLPKSPVQVGEFRVPKFKLSFSSSVTAVLEQLGLRLPFSPEADLSDMVDDGSGLPLVVEDVFHKAVIEVNEEGTEAAAVTMARRAAGRARMPRQPPPPVDFIADHPFAYFIYWRRCPVQSSSWDMSLTLR